MFNLILRNLAIAIALLAIGHGFIGMCYGQPVRRNGLWNISSPGYPAERQYQPVHYHNPQYAPPFNPGQKVDGARGYNSGRMAEIPQGADRLQLWVVVHPQVPQGSLDATVATWFTAGARDQRGRGRSADARLRKMQDECAFNYYASNSKLFTDSGLIEAVGSETPKVVLTKADGQVIAHLGPKTLGTIRTAGELADLLNNGIEKANPPKVFEGQLSFLNGIVSEVGNGVEQCPDGQCQPTPQPNQTHVPAALPEVVPSRTGPLNVALGLFAAAGLLVAGLTVFGAAAPFAKKS